MNNQIAGLSYDGAGNVMADNYNSYVYDSEGRISTPQTKSGLQGPRICALHNLASGNVTQYIFDGAPVDRSSSTGWDASGTRVAKGKLGSWPSSCSAPGSNFTLTNLYLLDGAGNQASELTVAAGVATWAHSNAWVGGHLTGTYDNIALHFTLSDPLGTKRVQSNASGTPEQNFIMLPWGNDFNNTFAVTSTTPLGGSAEPDATEIHFTQKERDVESGNDYFGARYFNSMTGRWLSPDWSAKEEPVPYAKLDNPQSLNLYRYLFNNPLSTVDPDGHVGAEDDPTYLTNLAHMAVVAISNGMNAGDAMQAELAQQQKVATPLTDKNGNVVQGANGKPALVPGGFDVNAVVKTGQSDKELRGYAPMVGTTQTAEDLANFRTGGKWDLQRLSGNFDPRFIDSATILIGMYAQAAGITRDQILSIQNDFAAVAHVIHGYPAGTPMDPTYTHLPVRNVTNTDIGMQLVQ